MKISILTPTYNRAQELKNLHESISRNLKNCYVDHEWLIMDDGSNDNTEQVVENFKKNTTVNIKYYKQENKGKMQAINNLIPNITGDVSLDCDSDDILSENCFKIIKDNYYLFEQDKSLYALVFIRKMKDSIKENDNSYKTKMFDLYFKNNFQGETAIVFKSNIRKEYVHELEKNEKFITEARMYHKMDLQYNIMFFYKNIQQGEYLQNGYTKNINELFKSNPFGYYEYFKEIFYHNMKGVTFKKRMYVYKHYILFSCLINQLHPIKNVTGLVNKAMVALLYVPGKIKVAVSQWNKA